MISITIIYMFIYLKRTGELRTAHSKPWMFYPNLLWKRKVRIEPQAVQHREPPTKKGCGISLEDDVPDVQEPDVLVLGLVLCVYIYIYIHMCIERERDLCLYIYIYIYTHTSMYIYIYIC